MTVLDRADQYIVGHVTFPVSNYLLNRRGILSRYRRLLVTEHLGEEALKELQLRKLTAVLMHAYEWSPFYAKQFKEVGFAPNKIKYLEDMRRIPPLTRKDVFEQRLDLVDSRYRESALAADLSGVLPGLPLSFARFRKHKLVRNTTTGSTGTPIVFYEDGSVSALNWAEELRVRNWFGLQPGVREARMTAFSTEFSLRSRMQMVRERLWNQQILPGYILSDREYELCLQEIKRFRPRILWALTTTLTALARYIQRTNADISTFSPDLLITRAAPLYKPEKDLLSAVFGCPVTNIYGSREVGHIAMTCPEGSLHLNQEDFLVEIEGQGITAKSTTGEVLVTELNVSPMPFVRYRLGDLAQLGGTDCLCGRSLRVLKGLLGRTGDVFTTKKGRVIEPGAWSDIFMVGRHTLQVEKFQVVYQRDGRVRLRLVTGPGFSAETEAELQALIRKYFYSEIEFEFEYVSDIKPLRTGKYAMIVNETSG